MAAPKLEVVRTDDGGAALEATVDGVRVTFGHVNPSQLEEARVAQGVAPAEGTTEESTESEA